MRLKNRSLGGLSVGESSSMRDKTESTCPEGKCFILNGACKPQMSRMESLHSVLDICCVYQQQYHGLIHQD